MILDIPCQGKGYLEALAGYQKITKYEDLPIARGLIFHRYGKDEDLGYPRWNINKRRKPCQWSNMSMQDQSHPLEDQWSCLNLEGY